MNLDQLPYFVSIAYHRSLSAASRHLNVSQQALSMYLAGLEKEIGMPLFFRNKKQLYLTEAGKRYLKGAQDIINVMERTRNAIHVLGREPDQKLHIGISAHTGALLLAECALEFMQRFPAVQLVPHEGYAFELQQMVQAGVVSLAVTGLQNQYPEDLKVIPFFMDEFVLALPAYHPRARKADGFDDLPVADLNDFREEVFVRSTPNTSTYHVFESVFEQAGFRPTVSVSSPNINMLTMLIRTGCGIGLLRYHEDPSLAFYRLKNPPYFTVAFLTQPGHVLSEPERFLIYLFNRHQRSVAGIRIQTDTLAEINREFGHGDFLSEEML